MDKWIKTDELKNKFKEKLKEYHYFVNKGRIEAIIDEISEEREDKFKNSPIHNKIAILEIMDKLEPA